MIGKKRSITETPSANQRAGKSISGCKNTHAHRQLFLHLACPSRQSSFLRPSLYPSCQSHCAGLVLCRLIADFSDPQEAGSQLIIIDPQTGSSTPIPSQYSSFGSLSIASGKLVTVGGSATKPSEVAVLDLQNPQAGKWSSLKKAIDLDVRLVVTEG